MAWAPLLWLAIGSGCATPDNDFNPPDRPVFIPGDIEPTKPSPWRRRLLNSVPKPVTLEGGVQGGLLVVTHGGVGSPPSVSDGPMRGAQAGLTALDSGANPIDAAIQSTVVMEDDPRFNAGTGSNIRLDGKTIQMDAALMLSNGAFAAVGVIERVKNPILVARAVLDSPHVFMAGEGATRFAHKMGFEDVVPTSTQAVAKYDKRMKRLGEAMRTKSSRYDWRQYWNFPGEMPADMKAWREGGDTVGTVARGEDGTFAATLSTGGTSVTLYGRVGDVPIFGAGTFAGPAGAVACTGHGEIIIENMLARRTYELMESGFSAKDAVHKTIAQLGQGRSLGLIAIDRFGWGVAANREMAWGKAHEVTRER